MEGNTNDRTGTLKQTGGRKTFIQMSFHIGQALSAALLEPSGEGLGMGRLEGLGCCNPDGIKTKSEGLCFNCFGKFHSKEYNKTKEIRQFTASR